MVENPRESLHRAESVAQRKAKVRRVRKEEHSERISFGAKFYLLGVLPRSQRLKPPKVMGSELWREHVTCPKYLLL